MLKNLSWCAILLLFTIFSCNNAGDRRTAGDIPKTHEPIKNIELIVGTWELQRVDDTQESDRGRRQLADAQNNAFQILEFDPEGRYTINSHTTQQAMDSGSYRLNEQHDVLYLHSAADETNPTEWDVEFNNDVMVLTSREGRGRPTHVKYEYLRTEAGLSRNQ